MVFSKSGRVPKDKLRYNRGGDEIEYVNNYKYLGVNLSNTGKFSVAEKKLKFKGKQSSVCHKTNHF